MEKLDTKWDGSTLKNSTLEPTCTNWESCTRRSPASTQENTTTHTRLLPSFLHQLLRRPFNGFVSLANLFDSSGHNSNPTPTQAVFLRGSAFYVATVFLIATSASNRLPKALRSSRTSPFVTVPPERSAISVRSRKRLLAKRLVL